MTLLKQSRMILIVLSLLNNIVIADSDVVLQKNQAAPFLGVLFSQPQAETLKNSLLERNELKLTNTSLNTTIQLKDSDILKITQEKTLLLKDNNNLADNLRTERNATQFTHFMYFALGVLGTSAAFFGARKLSQ